MGIGAIGLHEPESVAVVGEDDPLAIGGKFGSVERADSVGDLLQVVPVHADGVDLKIARVA